MQQAQPAADIINATQEQVPEPASTQSSTEPGALAESDASEKYQQSAAELKPDAKADNAKADQASTPVANEGAIPDIAGSALEAAATPAPAEEAPPTPAGSTPGPAGVTTQGTDATEDGRMPPPAGEVSPCKLIFLSSWMMVDYLLMKGM